VLASIISALMCLYELLGYLRRRGNSMLIV
jgi:hypothetical protein